MAERRTSTERKDSSNIVNLQLDVAVIKNDVAAIKASQASLGDKFDKMSFVSKHEFDSFKQDLEKNYVQQSDYKTIKQLIIAVILAIVGEFFYIISTMHNGVGGK